MGENLLSETRLPRIPSFEAAKADGEGVDELVRRTRLERFLASMNAIHLEIEEKISRGEISREEIEELISGLE